MNFKLMFIGLIVGILSTWLSLYFADVYQHILWMARAIKVTGILFVVISLFTMFVGFIGILSGEH